MKSNQHEETGSAVGAMANRDLQKEGLARRDFLICGATGVIGAIGLTLPAGATTAPTAQKSTLTPEFSSVAIGYWNGSALALSGAQSDSIPATVTAAHRIAADSADLLHHHARVTVHGLFGSPLSPATKAVEVLAHYRVDTPTGVQFLPFHAWHYHAGDVPRISKPARFTLPVDPKSGLRLSVTHRGRVSGQNGSETVHAQENDCRLALSGEEATAMLRPGFYLFALGDTRQSPTRHWSSLVFLPDREANGARRLFRRTLHGMKPVDFPYLIVSVEPARSEDRVTL